MYCTNCGEKLEENASFCSSCGNRVNNNPVVVQAPVVRKGNRGIASMVLGIIGAFFSLCMFTNFEELGTWDFFIENDSYFSFAMETIFVPMVFAIIAISLAGASRSKQKNGYNTAGLWLSIATFIISAIQFIYILAY